MLLIFTRTAGCLQPKPLLAIRSASSFRGDTLSPLQTSVLGVGAEGEGEGLEGLLSGRSTPPPGPSARPGCPQFLGLPAGERPLWALRCRTAWRGTGRVNLEWRADRQHLVSAPQPLSKDASCPGPAPGADLPGSVGQW